MKAAVVGKGSVVEGLAGWLGDAGLEVVNVSEVGHAVPLASEGKVVLLVVHGSVEECETLCCCVRQLESAPVVLAVSGKDTDWEGMQALDIDGYLPEWVGRDETLARVRAAMRRCLAGSRTGIDGTSLSGIAVRSVVN